MARIELPLGIPQCTVYSFEGPDGAGKSTQTGLVAAGLVRAGQEAVAVACPSDTVLGQFLRANLATLETYQRHTLFLLDMAGIVLANAANPKRILIADRWTDSNLVSNRDSTPEESAEWIRGIPRPRKTFLLDIDPRIVLSQRPESVHGHSADLAWQEMKRERYGKLVAAEPERFVVVDATQGKEVISSQIVAAILLDLEESYEK